MNQSVNTVESILSLLEVHEDLTREAVFELASTLRRGTSVTLGAHDVLNVVGILRDAIIQRCATDEQSARYVISVMAQVQGLCPNATWDRWYRLTAG